MTTMTLRVIGENDALTHIALAGRLDLPGFEAIHSTFMEHTADRGKPALVDLSDVTFLGSSGLRMFLIAAKALKGHGVKMILLNPQPSVEETLAYVAFNKVTPIEHDLARAMEILTSQ
jgi:anti-anti-sigma factor